MAIEYHIELPRLLSYQEAFLYCEARLAVCYGATKTGKTHAALQWLLECALVREGVPESRPTLTATYWWIAPSYAQAEIAFKRTKDLLREIGLPAEEWPSTANPMRIRFPSRHINTVIEFKTGDNPEALYGEDVYAAVMDEATRQKVASWNALRSTLTATHGKVRLPCNQTGRNWLTDLTDKAAADGNTDVAVFVVTFEDSLRAGHPLNTWEELENARKTLEHPIFRSLYYCERYNDGSNPFGDDRIEACASLTADSEVGEPVYLGLDIAKEQDFTVLLGLDEAGSVAEFDRFQGVDYPELVARVAPRIGRKRCLVDSTGLGAPVIAYLRRACPNVQPYQFNAYSKQALFADFFLAVQNDEFHFDPIKHAVLKAEMHSFETQKTPNGGVTYAARSGMHDDCVVAGALANRLRLKKATVGGRTVWV